MAKAVARLLAPVCVCVSEGASDLERWGVCGFDGAGERPCLYDLVCVSGFTCDGARVCAISRGASWNKESVREG